MAKDDYVPWIRSYLTHDEAFVYSLCVMSDSDAGYACVLSGSEVVVFGTIDEVQDWLINRESGRL